MSLALAGCGGGAVGAGSAAGSAATDGAGAAAEPVEVHVASLKGPTSIGLVQFMDQAADGATDNEFNFAISAAADEIVPKMIQGDVDIALVPANVASVLYNKTEGAVQVIDINTLGVLNVVTGNADVTSFGDLAGRTVYMTGKGTTPEYVMNYLLERAGLTGQVTLEFKSEPTEVLSALLADPSAVALYFVCNTASKYLKVVMSGEGADEIFGGYNIYKEPLAVPAYDKIPFPIRRFIGKVASHLPKKSGINFLIRRGKKLEDRFIGNAYMFTEEERKKLLKIKTDAPSPAEVVKPFYDRVKAKTR